MKVAISIEFTDDEIVKHAEDLGKRLTLNAIHEGIRHLGALKINPDVATTAAQAIASAFMPKTAPPPAAETETPPPPSPSLEKCLRIEPSTSIEEGWGCCRCLAYNGVQRSACRICGHERCDVIVPPAAPDPGPTAEGDPNLS